MPDEGIGADVDAVADADTELPTLPGSVRAVRKGKLREALFGATTQTDRFGRYELRGMLGRGGMGTVLEAHDTTLGRTIALKLLHADMAEHHGQRLLREARALAKLAHPNVVHVHEAGQLDGRAFIAMELVRGETLREWQQRRRTWRECVDAYVQAGRGLAAAHAAGLIHRDFKPSNCMIDEQGRVRVLDFGLVRELHVPESAASRRYPPSAGDTMVAQTLTRTGAVLGTLVYMAPEQLCGKAVDATSDQFSFCASLYEALYGVRPFVGGSVGEHLSVLMSGKLPPPPRGVHVPARVRRIVARGLALQPAERWPSMSALLRELGRPIRPQWLVRGALVLAVGAPVVAWSWHRSVVDALSTCREQRSQFEGTWGPDRRELVRTAIEGQGLSHAQHTWAEVDHRLDDYAERWGQRLEQTCEALVDDDQAAAAMLERRLTCLGHHWWAFDGTVAVLGEADEAITAHAVEMVSRLPSIDDCDDEQALVSLRMQAITREVDSARRGERVWRELARGRALASAGRHADASPVLEAAQAEAESFGMGTALAEALFERGRQLRAQGHAADAEPTLARAFETAAEHGHDGVAVLAAAELVALLGGVEGRVADAKAWEARARERIAGGHAGPRARAWLSSCVAELWARQGKLAQARAHHEKALEIVEQTYRDGPVHPDVATAHASLARILAREGRFDDAIHHYYHALVRREVVLGKEHPAVRATLVDMARVELGRAHPAAARSLASRAVDLGSPGDQQADAHTVARAQLMLARALWIEDDDRGYARTQGEQAQLALQRLAAVDDPARVEVERWLRDHPRPTTRP